MKIRKRQTISNVFDDSGALNRTDYVEKREIDRPTLNSFDDPFQLLL